MIFLSWSYDFRMSIQTTSATYVCECGCVITNVKQSRYAHKLTKKHRVLLLEKQPVSPPSSTTSKIMRRPPTRAKPKETGQVVKKEKKPTPFSVPEIRAHILSFVLGEIPLVDLRDMVLTKEPRMLFDSYDGIPGYRRVGNTPLTKICDILNINRSTVSWKRLEANPILNNSIARQLVEYQTPIVEKFHLSVFFKYYEQFHTYLLDVCAKFYTCIRGDTRLYKFNTKFQLETEYRLARLVEYMENKLYSWGFSSGFTADPFGEALFTARRPYTLPKYKFTHIIETEEHRLIAAGLTRTRLREIWDGFDVEDVFGHITVPPDEWQEI